MRHLLFAFSYFVVSLFTLSEAYVVGNNNKVAHRHVAFGITQPMMTVTTTSTGRRSTTKTTELYMESDFGTAMPDKPEQTVEEMLGDRATEFIARITSMLGEGVDEPPEVEALRKARDDKEPKEVMAARMYELMIEKGMLYDEDPKTGILTPTEWVITDNLDSPQVKEEFLFLYNYGIGLIKANWLSVDSVKQIVNDRLIARTGKTPEEFDAWLGF